MNHDLFETRTMVGAIARVAGAATLAAVLLTTVPAFARHGHQPVFLTPPYEFEMPGYTSRPVASATRKLRVEAASQAVMTDATTATPGRFRPGMFRNAEFGIEFSRNRPYHGRSSAR